MSDNVYVPSPKRELRAHPSVHEAVEGGTFYSGPEMPMMLVRGLPAIVDETMDEGTWELLEGGKVVASGQLVPHD